MNIRIDYIANGRNEHVVLDGNDTAGVIAFMGYLAANGYETTCTEMVED